MFSQLQPLEWLAILATVADLGLTVWAVQAGLAREANPLLLVFHGKRAAYGWVALGVALHLVVRWRLDNYFTDPQQARAWMMIAMIRGSLAVWNTKEIYRALAARHS